MRSWLKEFREFINRGNLVELAVAFVIAAAFARVVTSFIEDVFMNIVAKIVGQDDFASDVVIADTILIGRFISTLITFLIIAFVVFLILKAYDRFRRTTPAVPEAPTQEVLLLMEIRDLLRARQ